MADAMDVSLIENKKEESMKTFYEINNVIRMSFIEMQYMKKVGTYLKSVHSCAASVSLAIPRDSEFFLGNDECTTSHGRNDEC